MVYLIHFFRCLYKELRHGQPFLLCKLLHRVPVFFWYQQFNPVIRLFPILCRVFALVKGHIITPLRGLYHAAGDVSKRLLSFDNATITHHPDNVNT